MDPRLIDYYIINSAISSKIGISYRDQLDFVNPSYVVIVIKLSDWD